MISNVKSFKEVLIRLVELNNPLAALQNLDDFFRQNELDIELKQVALFTNQIQRLDQKVKTGIVSGESENLERNRIINNILGLINEVNFEEFTLLDPYWGLPPLPNTYLPNKPFRWLKHYTSNEAPIFLGRANDIRNILFFLIDNQNDPILLLFGSSGIGKSSLLNAGIIPRLSVEHSVVYLRSNLLAEFYQEFLAEYENNDLANFWIDFEQKKGKSLYIILDQFEELLIDSVSETEIISFFTLIKNIFKNPQHAPQGKLILSYRKEFHAEIESFCLNEELPFSTKFVKRLSKQNILEIIEGVVKIPRIKNKYHLSIPKEHQNLPYRIADDLSRDSNSPIAPVLQIILTKMWEKAKDREVGSPKFTMQLYQEILNEGIGLEDFLIEEIEKISNWDSQVVQSGLILDFLIQFVSEFGTAIGIKRELVLYRYSHINELIISLIQKLKENSLLVEIDSISSPELRLIHDQLAPIVRKIFVASRSNSQSARMILDAKTPYFDTNLEILLSIEEIEIISNALVWMRVLSQNEEKLLETSLEEQDRNKTLLHHYNAGKWTFDTKKKVVRVDGYIKKLLGLSTSGSLFPLNIITDKIHPEDQPIFDKALQDVIDNKANIQIQHRVILDGNNIKYLELLLSSESRKGRKTQVIYAIHQDITNRRQSDELARKLELSKESQKIRTEFLAKTSNEIRTPLNPILLLSNMLLETELTPTQKEYLMAIKTAGDTLLAVVNDFGDLSKIEMGKIDFISETLSIARVFESIMDMMEASALEKGIEVYRDIDEKIPKYVIGDTVRLTQIILNLVGNAIKFTMKGFIRISAKVKRREPGRVIIEFSVKDTGIGIPKDKLKVIFDSFQQLDTEVNQRYGGTGLGLTIVKQLVKLQGGNVSVNSEVGKGSRFFFELPFETTDEERQPHSKQIQADRLLGISILLVEDHPLNQVVTQKLLVDWGIDVSIANNGQEGIELLRSSDFNLVLMDTQMPVMNGYETIKFIRKYFQPPKQDIPIILLSANAFSMNSEKEESLQVQGFISKPIEIRKLYNKIVQVLNK